MSDQVKPNKVNSSQGIQVTGPHQSHQTGSNTDQWTCCDNDERQLPSFHKADAETAHKCGEALQKNGHLIRHGIVDLVDITATQTRPF